ncbi:hypothetical protein L6452_04201 [Arctium lappa]|uniref:Uncharacterized protein n=1 Tax=Arctium lappa TaxID=4217 RepID=A0ACB9FQC0_ARCLA|nr:hypothetical protein L6452_04201 [Arctium lappa]
MERSEIKEEDVVDEVEPGSSEVVLANGVKVNTEGDSIVEKTVVVVAKTVVVVVVAKTDDEDEDEAPSTSLPLWLLHIYPLLLVSTIRQLCLMIGTVGTGFESSTTCPCPFSSTGGIELVVTGLIKKEVDYERKENGSVVKTALDDVETVSTVDLKSDADPVTEVLDKTVSTVDLQGDAAPMTEVLDKVVADEAVPAADILYVSRLIKRVHILIV